MAAVGLAQNFAALRALATDGIQTGHMTLHARSVVTAAGAPAELFDEVLERVLRNGEIKVWKAQEILAELQQERARPGTPQAEGRASRDRCWLRQAHLARRTRRCLRAARHRGAGAADHARSGRRSR